MRSTRRQFLTHTAAGAAALIAPHFAYADPVRRFAPFDKLMTSFLEEHKVPGASLAITHDRELVYSRGFGLANVEKERPVETDSLFRIASISKPITAVAVMQLVDANKVKLDEPVMNFIRLKPHLEAERKPDPRWFKVTVRHCLQHTGGWDRDKKGGFDPIGMPLHIADVLDKKLPVKAEDVIRFMLGKPLDFDPGLRFAYSNLGFLLLGRVIEIATGRKYEDYVKKEVLAPLGIQRMQLGRSLPEDRAKGEVSYYDSKKSKGVCVIPPRVGERVPFPDGAANIEGYEAHGGWIASAVDLVKFAAAFDIPALCPILSRSAIETMWERPHGLAGYDDKGKPLDAYNGCGWFVRPSAGWRKTTWHNGLISGTSSLLVRRFDGLNWAVLFNTECAPKGKFLSNLIDPLLHGAAAEVFM